jgi:hypothetical protein
MVEKQSVKRISNNSLTPINARENKLVLQFTINSQLDYVILTLKQSASIYALGF